MKMLNTSFLPLRMVLLFLLLLGSSSALFSANKVSLDQDGQQEKINTSFIEHVDYLQESILSFPKVLISVKGRINKEGDFEAHSQGHTTISRNYLIRARFILPSLGVKEVIFPFHVFF